MSRGQATSALSDFTSEQWGMVTAAQARAAGVSRVDVLRLIDDGVLEPVAGAARVYRLRGAPPHPDLETARAAWLQLGDERPGSERLRAPDAVAAGRTAALLRGLGDLGVPHHDFYVFRRRQLRRTDLRLRVRTSLDRSEWTVVDGLPVSTAAYLLDDLLSVHEDGSAVARICRDALTAHLLAVADLTSVAGPYASAYGASSPVAFVDELLDGDSVTVAAS